MTALVIVQMIVGIGLIAAVLIQPSKSEGLGTAISGQRESARSKGGVERLLDRVTQVLAISFLIVSLFVALMSY